MMIELGFLGLGQMGAAMAERLESPDVRLHVFDPVAAHVAPFAARGAQVHATGRAVADAAPIVFACLPTPEVSLRVAREVAAGSAVRVHVEMSTIGRPAIERVAAVLAPHGIALVDAPVSGGPDGARSGRLAVMAAGEPTAMEKVRPHLQRIAGTLFEVGSVPGLGQTMKLVNNLIAAASVAVTGEAVVAGAKAGLDPDTMVRVINASSGRSNVTSWLLPGYVLNGRFDFGATIATMLKDVELALGEAKALGLPMAANSAAAALWLQGAKWVGAEQDMTRFFSMLENEAQVKLRSAGASDAV